MAGLMALTPQASLPRVSDLWPKSDSFLLEPGLLRQVQKGGTEWS